MPEADQGKDPKDYHLDVPVRNRPFFLNGAGAQDWGMQNRFAKIFNPESGRTVMLAIDHGYFQGPTTGLERIEVQGCLNEDETPQLQGAWSPSRQHGLP